MRPLERVWRKVIRRQRRGRRRQLGTVGPGWTWSGPAVYAWQTTRTPRDPACPASGWIHEGGPPWRVITSADPERLRKILAEPQTQVAPYTGAEHTIDVDEWMVHPRPGG